MKNCDLFKEKSLKDSELNFALAGICRFEIASESESYRRI